MSLTGRKKSYLQPDSGQGMLSLFSSLQDEINSVFDNFLNTKLELEETNIEQAFVPAIDIVENENAYTVRVELPGLREDDINLQVDSGQLVLRGERKQQHEEKIESILVNESCCGSFYRSFQLPDNVDAEKQYCADLENGILSIILPKKQDSISKIKSIPIRAK